jgi:hypothetical protein
LSIVNYQLSVNQKVLGVMRDCRQIQPNQPPNRISGGFFDLVIVVNCIEPIRCARLIRKLPELFGIPGKRRKQPGIIGGFHLHKRTRRTSGSAVFLHRAFGGMHHIKIFAVPVRAPFCRA